MNLLRGRGPVAVLTVCLLGLAWWRIPSASAAGQAAVPHSRAGQEDLTFWVNHHGLGEIDVDGPVGFGDMARLLMRRRANAQAIRALRDRFVFRSTDPATLVPIAAASAPERLVIAQGRVFNLVDPANGRVHRILERDPGVMQREVAGRT
ncbi:MAG: hypothetical protein FJW31_11250 [Acidobacteria bacterium]|nr:hypothetical protein [Acidobacteriota bacterium]